MNLPFPGMDPFLEAPSLWPDVHSSLIYEFRNQIQRQLNPNYVAAITPYVTFESLEIATARRAAVPDVGVLEAEPYPAAGVAVAAPPALSNGLATAPLTLPAVMNVPTRYARLEVRAVDGEELITAIELLSPANKRRDAFGQVGAPAYERKRQQLFQTDAHLLEIDLLRAGVRPQVARPLPEQPYFIFLSRAERRPNLDIWPIELREPLPIVPVPLRRPDPDVALDVGAALREVYAGARYERRIDYGSAPPPPALSNDDAAWIDEQLRQQKLR